MASGSGFRVFRVQHEGLGSRASGDWCLVCGLVFG